MIPAFLIPVAAKLVGERFAKPLIIGAAIVMLILALGVAKCAYDKSVIGDHDTKQALQQEKADRKADAKAAETRREDDTRQAKEAAQLEKVNTNAQSDTDRRLARQRCIRMQQAARRDGGEPPACG